LITRAIVGYKNYNRDHVWRFDSGVEVPEAIYKSNMALLPELPDVLVKSLVSSGLTIPPERYGLGCYAIVTFRAV
jgi:hypothetical protein